MLAPDVGVAIVTVWPLANLPAAGLSAGWQGRHDGEPASNAKLPQTANSPTLKGNVPDTWTRK